MWSLSDLSGQAAARTRATGFGVLTPITSRYTTIEISAIADGMTTKEWIYLPRSGARKGASDLILDGLEEARNAPR